MNVRGGLPSLERIYFKAKVYAVYVCICIIEDNVLNVIFF